MLYLIHTARTYVMMYKVTGQRHYLDKAWTCLARVKFMSEETRELKLVA